jgi:hypothetical protein
MTPIAARGRRGHRRAEHPRRAQASTPRPFSCLQSPHSPLAGAGSLARLVFPAAEAASCGFAMAFRYSSHKPRTSVRGT